MNFPRVLVCSSSRDWWRDGGIATAVPFSFSGPLHRSGHVFHFNRDLGGGFRANQARAALNVAWCPGILKP